MQYQQIIHVLRFQFYKHTLSACISPLSCLLHAFNGDSNFNYMHRKKKPLHRCTGLWISVWFILLCQILMAEEFRTQFKIETFFCLLQTHSVLFQKHKKWWYGPERWLNRAINLLLIFFLSFARSFFTLDDSRAWICSCAHDFRLIGECLFVCFGALLLLCRCC